MKLFKLEIITPSRVYDEGEVDYVRCPGLDGYLGIMANHTGALIALGIGAIKVNAGKDVNYFATSGGYVEIRPDKVQMLLETAERSDELNLERSKKSLQRAKERLERGHYDIDTARSRVSLTRAINRIKISSL